MSDLTQSELKRLLKYDPGTGFFTWRVTRGGTARAGSKAGGVNLRGYVKIAINRRRYLAHRLVWLYVHGRWPSEFLDHINKDTADNRLSNLREASNSENQGNSTLRSDSTTGLKGVGFRKTSRKWVARLRVAGKQRHLGSFNTPEAAHRAYCIAARAVHGNFFSDGTKKRKAFRP